jgi:hypothetical protein
VKCNIDGVAINNTAACRGIFGNYNSDHLGSFSNFIGQGNALIVELIAAMLAIEIALEKNWVLNQSLLCLGK